MAFEVRNGGLVGGFMFLEVRCEAPLLDGSTVTTNICTDVDLQWNQQTVDAAIQASQTLR
ncbi:hypothetical protein NQZ68_029210, partial [Dissostichus eleginoides]